MTRTSLVLDSQSLATLRRLSKRMDASQSEVVRRSLRLLEQREVAAPANPAAALRQMAEAAEAGDSWSAVKTRIRKQRQDRHAADDARG